MSYDPNDGRPYPFPVFPEHPRGAPPMIPMPKGAKPHDLTERVDALERRIPELWSEMRSLDARDRALNDRCDDLRREAAPLRAGPSYFDFLVLSGFIGLSFVSAACVVRWHFDEILMRVAALEAKP